MDRTMCSRYKKEKREKRKTAQRTIEEKARGTFSIRMVFGLVHDRQLKIASVSQQFRRRSRDIEIDVACLEAVYIEQALI